MARIDIDISVADFSHAEIVDYIMHTDALRAKVEEALAARREQRAQDVTLRDWERAALDGLIHG